jgi:hypothetical protein
MDNPPEQIVNEPDDEDITGVVDVHQRALQRFDDITSAVQEERALNLRDRRFATIAGAQWEDQWFRQFENSIRVEVNKTMLGVERIIADYREHRLVVNFRGVDKGADEETAETLDGMFRADYYRSHGSQATDNAFEEAVLGGIGAWRLKTSYCDENDPEDDRQQIDFEMIPDADQCVFWDMDARLQDKSDAEFAFVLTAMSYSGYEEQYGEDPASWPTNLLKTHYDWYTPDVVYVAEYYVVERKKERLYVLVHPLTKEERREWASDMDSGELDDLKVQGWEIERTRSVMRRKVRKYTMSASGMIGDYPKGQIIAGDQIPIIPVYGKRWYVDNMERTRGHVRLAVDPQRIYNSQISKLVETASFSPIERPIFTPDQIPPAIAEQWATANIDRAAFAYALPVIDPVTGGIAALGPIGKVEAPNLPPALPALIQLTATDIAELTSADDGADETKSNVSAEAMDIAATRTDKRSFTYIDNMKQAWKRCGEVYQSMSKDVYVEEGREVDVMDDDGEQGTAVLMQPKTDEKSGAFTYANNIHEGRYKVIADVTEATATRRDKTVKTCLNGAEIVGQTDPELANALITTAFMNMDGEGITDLQDWLRKRALQSGLVKPTDEEKAAMQEAETNQQPDPQIIALQAQVEALQATAGKEAAMTEKYKADTALSAANTKKAQAETAKIQAETHDKQRFGVFDRVTAAAKAFAKPATR